MKEAEYKVTAVYGHKEICSYYRMEDNKLVCYGYSIDYDEDGFERHRTKPEAISSISFGE